MTWTRCSRIAVIPDVVRVARQGRDQRQDLRREAALGGEGQRLGAVVVHPQPGLIHAEQRERLVDDVLEQAREVLLAADVRRDPEQRRAAIEEHGALGLGRRDPIGARRPSGG